MAGIVAGLLVFVWPLWAVLPLLLAVGCATWCAVSRYALLQPADALVALRYASTGEMHVQLRDGSWHAVTLLSNSCVTAWGAVLNFRLAGRRFGRSMVIVPDAVDAEEFRRLRVRLRWSQEA